VTPNELFPVVGIGSSAGGVEALQLFFQKTPADTGMAFILVSHLARDYQSLLPEIVARHARMRVTAASDGEDIEPNTVYVCPPNHILTVENHTLRLTPRSSDQQHKPIDVFLSSLAEQYAESGGWHSAVRLGKRRCTGDEGDQGARRTHRGPRRRRQGPDAQRDA
jgi:two-component system CheB/CheR fusion protein